MPIIKPFKAVVYNQDRVKDPSSVVAPPYDIIPKEMQNKLYLNSPYNIVRLILGKIKKDDDIKDNRYVRAKSFLETWLKKKILVQQDKEALYVYSQKYKDNKKYKEMTGFIGLLELDTKDRKTILPHENTLLVPKMDRLNLIREVRSNLSPIFVLYEDNLREISNILREARSNKKPFVDIDFDDVRHKVWVLDDEDMIKRIKAMMLNKDVFIADGHHRYEVARAYSVEIQNKNLPAELKNDSKYTMVYFVGSDEDMPAILPAHRAVINIGKLEKENIVKKLSKFFYLEKVDNLNMAMSRLERFKSCHAFGMYLGKRLFYVLRLKDEKVLDEVIKDKSKEWKRLDVAILHLFIIQYILRVSDEDENVEFVKDAKEAVRLVDKGRCGITFLLNPTKVEEVKKIARLGERMPRKSTYFYPKPLSGLVINKFG